MAEYLEKRTNDCQSPSSPNSAVVPEDRLLTMKEAALYLNVKRSKMYELIHEPNFPLIILSGRGYRVSFSDLHTWVQSKKITH